MGSMIERTNEEWIKALQDQSEQESALVDLRLLLLNGLRRGLINWVNPANPEFESLVDDFAQESLLKVLDNLDSFEGRSKFTTWAYKIAVRVALTELRRKRWQERSLDELDSAESPLPLPDQRPSPAQQIEQSDSFQRLEQIIDSTLTPKQREAMIGIAVEEMPIEELAQRMNMNRNALYKLLHDARLKLKKQLLEEGLTPEMFLGSIESKR